PANASPRPGHTAPSFTLGTLDDPNRTVSLADLLKHGEPVVINAWASWCPPCAAETPRLVQMAEQYRGRIQLVGINMTADDKLASARSFAKKYHIPYLLLADTDGAFAKAYQIEGSPTTFLVDHNGQVVWMKTGELNGQDLRHMVKLALTDGQSS
ncbi:MAG: TlpA family protein disulfide reductase, partial [Alicyclobacillus herbarius]|uniref:TlpA family protein disulfide reductase n=1 Tax=Alicyclobacillus herbarius TaxID=122960 RepID=UPI0023529296